MADVTLNIRHNADQATSSVKSLSNAMGSFASNSKKAIKAGTAVAHGFSKIGKAAFNIVTLRGVISRLGKAISSISRIAKYRLIRAGIKYVTDSFKEGLQAAYNWSKTQGGANAKLAGAMDNLSAASGRMKLQLGAAFGGLIVAIEPILIKIINLVTAAADALTQFFAILNGQGLYKKAVGGFDKIGSGAGGAEKKIKGLLASWDELNVIGKESGGGGGGSSGSGDTGDYEWSEIESDWAKLFASGDFFGIGEKITESLHGISQKFSDWIDGLKEMEIGTKLASFLNGLFDDPSMWSDIGESIGKFFGFVASELAKFFMEFDIGGFFRSVASFFTGFAEGFFKEMKDVFPEGSFLDNVFEGGNLLFSALDNLLSNNLEWQRFKLTWQILWNDIKTTALEAWGKILEMFNNPIGKKIFPGLDDALAKNKSALAGAKDEAETLNIHYGAITRTLSESKKKTDSYNKSLDGMNGKDVKLKVEPVVEDINKVRPIGHGKKVVAEGKKALPIPTEPDLKITTGFTEDMKGKVVKPRTFKATPALGSTTQYSKDMKDKVTKEKAVKVTPELAKKTLPVSATLSNPDALTKAVKSAMQTSVSVRVSGGGQTGNVQLLAKESGGFVNAGQIFLARESGPELVGTMGNSTAVANNEQIVAGIQNGVAQANAEQNELLRQQNGILVQLLNKQLTITPSVALGQVVARSTALYGRA